MMDLNSNRYVFGHVPEVIESSVLIHLVNAGYDAKYIDVEVLEAMVKYLFENPDDSISDYEIPEAERKYAVGALYNYFKSVDTLKSTWNGDEAK